MPRVSPARRFADDEVDGILGTDDGKISLRSLVQQGISAVLVGLLGLFVLAGVSTLSAPYSTAATGATTTIGGSVDVTRAEPVTSPLDLDLVATTTLDASSDLNDPSRNEDISRNSLRSELNKAVSEELQQQRDDSLAQVEQQVAAGAQNAAAEERAATLTGQNGAIVGEQARVQAEAEAKAAAQKKAEQAALAAGTLKNTGKSGSTKSNAVDPSFDAALAALSGSSGCTTPIAPGAYIRGAGFGQYGSWSRYHTGVDLSAPYGTPVRAVCDGIVIAKDGGGWAGINVAIAHAGGGATLYAHMSSKTVRPGQFVTAGQVIGYVGLTGRTFGTHCHFEYYPNPSTIGDPYTAADPTGYMLRKGVRI